MIQQRNWLEALEKKIINDKSGRIFDVKIDGRNFFDQPINDDIKTYEKITETATGQGDDYTTGCLLDYHYF